MRKEYKHIFGVVSRKQEFQVSYLWEKNKSIKLQTFVWRVNLSCSLLKVPILSKFLFSYQILYITQWTFAEEKFDLNKTQSFLEVLKTVKFVAILVHRLHQSSLGLEWAVTYIKEHMISGLFYLRKFNSVVHKNHGQKLRSFEPAHTQRVS